VHTFGKYLATPRSSSKQQNATQIRKLSHFQCSSSDCIMMLLLAKEKGGLLHAV